LFFCVATATVIFNAGSCTGGRDTFLCADKEKYPKENRPIPLASCALAVLSGFARKDFPSFWQSAVSYRPLYALWVLRAIPDKYPKGTRPPVLGAA